MVENMQKELLENLFSKDSTPLAGNDIPLELLTSLDKFILDKIEENSIIPEVINIYQKFQPMKQDAPEAMKIKLFTTIKSFAMDVARNEKILDSLVLFRFLVVKANLVPQDYFSIAEGLQILGNSELSKTFLEIYVDKEQNKPLLFLTLGNFYNFVKLDLKKAVQYYEKYISIDETKPVVYTILANLYSRLYGDESLKEQILYYEKAYSLKPTDRLSLHGLAFNYEKLGNKDMADFYYQKLLENEPTDTDFYNYGLFLISCGDFIRGHRFLRHRKTNLNSILPLDKKWDLDSDIKDKTLLIHFEEGFGDTFMYCRFVPLLKKYAQKIIFVVQDKLCDLIKNSPFISDGVDVISDTIDINSLEYDCWMGILDSPYVLKTTVENIPFPDKYLEVSQNLISNFAKNYLKNSENIKVGIAYHGDMSANYFGRDLSIDKFKPLLVLSNCDFYSFQYDEEENIYGVISLGKTFDNFTDTAMALKNMDLIITTDNVILNLAGALGVKTFTLFNKQTNYRWFKLKGENVGWYDSCTPFQVESQDDWLPVFAKLVDILKNYKK